MQINLTQIDRNVLAAAILAVAAIVAVLVERIVVTPLGHWARRRGWSSAAIVIASARGLAGLWLLILGAYLAVRDSALPPDARRDLFRTLSVILIATGAVALSRVAIGYIASATRGIRGAVHSTTIFVNLTRIFFVVVTILVILDYLGISITPILTALGVGGLAVALAMQETLSNLFAGLQLAAAKQIRLGDYVKLTDGNEGFVRDITWRNTVLETLESNTIVIPNSAMATSTFTNFHLPSAETAEIVTVSVAYGSDLAAVERATMEVYERTLTDFGTAAADGYPPIRFRQLADSGISFDVALPSPDVVGRISVRNEFIKRLVARYAADGIRIPSPVRTIDLRSLPPELLHAGANGAERANVT